MLQRLSRKLERPVVSSASAGLRTNAQRPASAIPPIKAPPRSSPRRARTLAGRRQQRTQASEAVGVHQPDRHQFAQGVLQFAAQQMGIVLQFVEEQRAMGLQAIEHALRPR